MSWFVRLQNALPQHGLSRIAGRLAESENEFISQLLIQGFAEIYDVDLDEAEHDDVDDYDSFNAFFTRALEDDARPVAPGDGTIVCPADGQISQAGKIDRDTLLQAKGHSYRLASLAGPLGAGLENGTFCTIYLAPRDYHRVHLPYDATLESTFAIPGALFSVNATTEAGIEGLFCRNERLVCRFETAFGPMLVILVGALIVASIETVWDGPQSPYRQEIRTEYLLGYEKGDEIGRFLLGSTVITCFPQGAVELDDLEPGKRVRMGEVLGRINRG